MLRLMFRWDGDRYGAKEDWEDEQRRAAVGAFGIDSWTRYHLSADLLLWK